jgi:hypothetical protein
MYDLQLDPESNRMAVTIPRTREAFDSRWAKSLGDPANVVRAILLARLVRFPWADAVAWRVVP